MNPSSKRVSVTAGVLVGMFLAALEATVVATAIPTIVATFGGLEIYSWVISAYLLTSTVTVPVWGRVSDLYGRRPLYLLSVFIFLAGSILSGMAGSMTELIVARAIQGLGAGGLLPLGMTIIGELYTPVERARMQGYFSGVWGFASVVGPVVGGFLTDHLSWRWVFYINIPFGLLAGLIIATQLQETRRTATGRRLDLMGVFLFTLSMSLLIILLVSSERAFDVRSPRFLALLAGTMFALAWFLWSERRSPEPLIPVTLFRNKVFFGATLNAFLAGMAMFGLLSFIPLFVQGVLGTGATEAGSVLTPLLLAWVLFSTIGGRLLLRFTFRQVMLAGMIVLLTGFVLLDLMDASTTRATVLLNVSVLGAGMGLATITSMVAVQDSVERPMLGIATSTSQFFRSIGGAIGVALMGTALNQEMNREILRIQDTVGTGLTALEKLASNPDAFLQPSIRETLTPESVRAFQLVLGSGLHSVFVVGTVIGLIALVSVALMPSTRLAAPTGRPLASEEAALR